MLSKSFRWFLLKKPSEKDNVWNHSLAAYNLENQQIHTSSQTWYFCECVCPNITIWELWTLLYCQRYFTCSQNQKTLMHMPTFLLIAYKITYTFSTFSYPVPAHDSTVYNIAYSNTKYIMYSTWETLVIMYISALEFRKQLIWIILWVSFRKHQNYNNNVCSFLYLIFNSYLWLLYIMSL